MLRPLRTELVLLFATLSVSGCGRNELARVLEKHTEIIDLSYALQAGDPHWPGGKYFPLRLDTLASIERDGVFSLAYHIPEHYGTHVDAPNHFVAGQISVADIPVQNLFAPMVVIDIAEAASKNADYQLEADEIERWENIYGPIPDGAVVFLHTGWGARWVNPEAYRNADAAGVMHFPAFGVSGARFLVEQRRIKAVGIDNLSIDAGISKDFPVHKIVNGAGAYALENVANLEKVPTRGAYVVVAPIKIQRGSGGQARVFAIVP